MAFRDIHDLVQRVRPSQALTAAAQTESVIGDVIAANERVVMLGLPFPGLEDRDALGIGKRLSGVRERYCFCSVFDECFVVDTDVSTRVKPGEGLPQAQGDVRRQHHEPGIRRRPRDPSHSGSVPPAPSCAGAFRR